MLTIKIPGYATASTFVALGGILNGFDTGSIGAVTEMPAFLATFGPLSPSLRGFTVSLIMLTGALPSFFAGQVADRLGRLRVITAGALVFALGAALQASASQLAMFLVGRALCGIGEGLWLSNVSVYIAEIAPSSRRGRYVSLPQFGAAVGVCAGYFTCYGSVRVGGSGGWAWRVAVVVMGGVAAVLAAGCGWLPESPRWLIVHGRRERAMRELERLDFAKVEAEKDVLRPIEQGGPEVGLLEGLRGIWKREARGRTVLALFVLAMVQLSGIDGVLYYAPSLFAQAGIPSQTSSFLASGISAILMLVISIPAFLYADRWGRRTSAISGGLVLSFCMLLVGTLYATHAVHGTGPARWFVIIAIFVFALAYASTWAIFAKIYASEIQETRNRATANSLANGLSFFSNFLVGMTTPIFLAKSAFGAYFLFGFLSLATVAVLYLVMPETRGRSLESIGEAFRDHRVTFRSWTNLLRGAASREIVAQEGLELEMLDQREDVVASGALREDVGMVRVLTTA